MSLTSNLFFLRNLLDLQIIVFFDRYELLIQLQGKRHGLDFPFCAHSGHNEQRSTLSPGHSVRRASTSYVVWENISHILCHIITETNFLHSVTYMIDN